MTKETQKHLDITEDEVKEYLESLKELVNKNRFKIADKNREKNIEFINLYRLKHRKQKEMLLNLEVSDFCYVADNYKNDEKLYVFCKEYELDNWGTYESVLVYIKINIIEKQQGKFCIIVSFHEPEKDLKWLFK